MKTCTHCARAKTDGYYHGRDNACAECDVRILATGKRALREAAFDHAERWLGGEAAAKIRRLVAEEWARIKALRGL